jgi:hypothetical protein
MSIDDDEQQILALHEAGDKALMSADLAVLAQIFADDYVQYNESGKAFTKQDVLESFRSGAIRYPSIVSTGRQIRVFGDTAVVHGSESDEVESPWFSSVYLCVPCARDLFQPQRTQGYTGKTTGKLLFLRPQPVLPVRPEEPCNPAQQ